MLVRESEEKVLVKLHSLVFLKAKGHSICLDRWLLHAFNWHNGAPRTQEVRAELTLLMLERP